MSNASSARPECVRSFSDGSPLVIWEAGQILKPDKKTKAGPRIVISGWEVVNDEYLLLKLACSPVCAFRCLFGPSAPPPLPNCTPRPFEPDVTDVCQLLNWENMAKQAAKTNTWVRIGP